MDKNIMHEVRMKLINLVRKGYFKNTRVEKEFINDLYKIIQDELNPEKKDQCNHKPVVIFEHPLGKTIKCEKCGVTAEVDFNITITR